MMKNLSNTNYKNKIVFIFVIVFILLSNNIKAKTKSNSNNNKIQVFFFFSTTCPLCKYFTKELNQINELYGTKTKMTIVFPGKYKVKEIKKYNATFDINMNFHIDSKLKMSQKLNATVTPQVIVTRNDTILYSGLINNSYLNIVNLNVNKAENYLANALDTIIVLNKKIINCKTEPIGCLIKKIILF